MAGRGFLVFKEQGVLAPDEQIRASELWGGREIHSTHGVRHPFASCFAPEGVVVAWLVSERAKIYYDSVPEFTAAS